MEILRFLFYALMVYIAYRFLFGLVIPLFRTTRRIRRGFREMQEHMNRAQQPQSQPSPKVPSSKPMGKDEDYIEFEEIK